MAKFGPQSPNSFLKTIKGQIRTGNAAQMRINQPPKLLERGSFNQARANVAKLNNMKAAVAMNPGRVRVPRPMTTPPSRYGTAAAGNTFTRPPAPGASIRALRLPKYPGGGIPKLLPKSTPKANVRVVPASLAARNIPGPRGSSLTAAQRMFQTAPRAQRGLPSTIQVASPAGRYFQRSPAFIAALSGISGSFSDAQVELDFSRVPALAGLGEMTAPWLKINGLGAVVELDFTKVPALEGLGEDTPPWLKINGLGALGDVRSDMVQRINNLFNGIIVPALEQGMTAAGPKIEAFVKKQNIPQGVLTFTYGAIGWDPTAKKMDPNSIALTALKDALVDLSFNNLNGVTKAFDAINSAAKKVGLPDGLIAPTGLKGLVIRELYNTVFGVPPSEAMKKKMDADFRSLTKLSDIEKRLRDNQVTYAEGVAATAAAAGRTALDVEKKAAAAVGGQTNLALIVGGVAVAGVVAFIALRK